MMRLLKTLVLGSFLMVPTLVMANPVVIDVRTESEYNSGHVESALHIPFDQIADRIGAAGIDQDAEVVLYCRSGRRASIAQQTLENMGYSNVHNAEHLKGARSYLNRE